MEQMTIKEALESGYEQCMPKGGDGNIVALISELTSDEDLTWLGNPEKPIMIMSNEPDEEMSNKHGFDWYPITNIRLIP